MMLEFSDRTVAPDIAVFEMKGRFHSGGRLSDAEFAVKKLMSAGHKKLVIDITGIDYMDSAALGMLVFITGTTAKEGGTVYVAGANPRIREILEMSHAHLVLNLKESLESALKEFGAA
jgi:anti-sigma B factor antagonist